MHLIFELDNICIYGSTIDAYTAVQALLDYGIQGSRIILTHPLAASPTTCFNNSLVEETVAKSLKEAGLSLFIYQILKIADSESICVILKSKLYFILLQVL